MWQLGAYFGHSLLGVDLNNDSYDDLLVSAPLYADAAGFDQGKVFVFMNNRSSPGPSLWVGVYAHLDIQLLFYSYVVNVDVSFDEGS